MNLSFVKHIKSFLRQPLHFYSRPAVIILLNVLITSFMLALYQPFGYRLENWAQFGELLGDILIVLVLSWLFFYLIPRRKGLLNDQKVWPVGIHVLYLASFLLLTGFCIFLYDFHVLSKKSFLDYGNAYFYHRMSADLIGTFAIGIFPLCIGHLWNRTYVLKKNLHDEAADAPLLVLEGETKESLVVAPEKIVYMESSGNYVDVFYEDEQSGLMRKTIRTTLKGIERQLKPYPYLMRCHRTYLVNCNFIVKLGRNAQGYRLHLRDSSEEVPVSRTYLSHLKEVISI